MYWETKKIKPIELFVSLLGFIIFAFNLDTEGGRVSPPPSSVSHTAMLWVGQVDSKIRALIAIAIYNVSLKELLCSTVFLT